MPSAARRRRSLVQRVAGQIPGTDRAALYLVLAERLMLGSSAVFWLAASWVSAAPTVFIEPAFESLKVVLLMVPAPPG